MQQGGTGLPVAFIGIKHAATHNACTAAVHDLLIVSP
jgi:hypothetical protein